MTRGGLRTLRASTATLLGLGLGVGGHALTGRSGLGGAELIAVAGVALFALAWLLAGRERGAGTIGAVLAAGQGMAHLVLTVPSLSTGGSEAPRDVAFCILHPSALSGTGGGAGSVALMIGAHAIATVVCAWWLRRGERWFAARLRCVSRVIGRALARRSRVARSLGPSLGSWRHLDVFVRPARCSPGHGWSRRGPPTLLARV